MVERIAVEFSGAQVELLADRALHWPSKRRLVIADLHLGKDAVFRQAGIAVPTGTTGSDLDRLSRLLQATGAAECWVLGDFLHGPEDASNRAAWQRFTDAHAGIAFCILPGNHDRVLRGRDGLLADPTDDPPLRFTHDAPPCAGAFVVRGHVHPVVKLRGITRTPAFWIEPGRCTLPAFSDFTGGARIAPRPGDTLVLCDGEALVVLPA